MSSASFLASMLTRFHDRQLRSAWHSFDRRPWCHPWISTENLTDMREFSRSIRKQARQVASRVEGRAMRFGFVCNVANSMYSSAMAMRRMSMSISIFPHPADDFIMSQPEWEEFDGSAVQGVTTLTEAKAAGLPLPAVNGVERISTTTDWSVYTSMPEFVGLRDYAKWGQYYAYLPLLEALRGFDSLYAIQAPYLAYLAKRPYMATHMGGDIWYECSRDDQIGRLQRAAFGNAGLLIASNPWSYAFARRYGFRNMVYVPTLLDPDFYSPGEPDLRHEWQQMTGGDFFVLSSARIDNFFKGANMALDAVTPFLRANPGARLVLIAWGSDVAKHKEHIRERGLEDQVIFLPPAGKRRLVRYLRSAHVLLDQFVLGYYGMTALEGMAVGVPVIMKLLDGQYDAFSDAGAPPVCNADDPEAIRDFLERLLNQPGFAAEVSLAQRRWFMSYSGDASWAESYRDILVALASGYKFDFSGSPLGRALGREEREYHRSELAAAPEFPNYF